MDEIGPSEAREDELLGGIEREPDLLCVPDLPTPGSPAQRVNTPGCPHPPVELTRTSIGLSG